MKISNSIYAYNFTNPFSNNIKPKQSLNNTLSRDIVSFSGKKYDADSIVNPTNHCAYCGCKVYSEAQLESIAKELLSSKAERLQGKIKSVLEKLEEAKQSQEISLAKRLENEEEIKFFKNYLDTASKKSFLKGSAIFDQVYNLNEDDAFALVVKNLHPLLATIDHVSPQKEDKDNNNSDINLVEACWCCNHDLKKGASFNEFYTMFPSIKNNMPPEKFEYAISDILDSSQTTVLQRLSATNLVKFIDRLFIQRTEAANYLDSIDFRIKGCKAGIDDAIENCKAEIAQKEQEIAQNQAKLDELKKDPEYLALLKRIELNNKLEDEKSVISLLRDKRQKISNSINELRNKKQSKNKNADDLSPEEKEEKIASMKANIDALTQQISKHEESQLDIEIEIEELDKQFPTYEMILAEKNRLAHIINCYLSLYSEKNNLQQKTSNLDSLCEQEALLDEEISALPKEDFSITSYSEDEQQIFEKYKELLEAADFISQHPNGNSVKHIINSYAQTQIEKEILELEKEPVIIAYNNSLKKKELTSQLQSNQKQIQDLKNQINVVKKHIAELERIVEAISKEDAENKVENLVEIMRRLSEKQNYVKLPQIIASLKAEVVLLNSTISDLEKKKSSIEAVEP